MARRKTMMKVSFLMMVKRRLFRAKMMKKMNMIQTTNLLKE